MTFRSRASIAGAAIALLVAPELCAQGAASPRGVDAATARFLARARAATARYKSQDEAIADGYKRVGVEFPAMGEHWVHLGHVLEDSLLAERPAILIYVNIGGVPSLAGVGYADLLTPGEPLPAFPAAGMWHEHNGSVDEESFPLTHHATPDGRGAGRVEPRLAVLHAWIWRENPAGVFVTDNWSLPFARLGVAPRPLPRTALNALALASDEEGYYLLTLRTALSLSARDEATAAAVLASQRRAARLIPPADIAGLEAQWSRLWSELERALPRHGAALRALRAQLE